MIMRVDAGSGLMHHHDNEGALGRMDWDDKRLAIPASFRFLSDIVILRTRPNIFRGRRRENVQ